jgi:hypothetical protein
MITKRDCRICTLKHHGRPCGRSSFSFSDPCLTYFSHPRNSHASRSAPLSLFCGRMPRSINQASLPQEPSLDAQGASTDLNTNMRSPQLYALYKQATQDPPIDKAENPGTFDFKVSQGSPLYKPCSTYQGYGTDGRVLVNRAKPRSAPGRRSLMRASHPPPQRRSMSSWSRA